MLTGRGPYDDPNATEFVVYNKIVNEPLPEAKNFYPNISGHIQAVIHKATAKNPDDRFQDCQEFKNALQNIGFSALNQTRAVPRPATVVPGTGGYRKDDTGFQKPEERANNPVVTKKTKSNAWLIGLLIAVFLAVGMWYVSLSGEESTAAVKSTSDKNKSADKPSSEIKDPDVIPEETTSGETDSQPEIIAPEEIIRPDRQAGTGLTIPDISLYCEISDQEDNGVRENIKVLIVLSNTSQSTAYNNVSIKFAFYDEANNKVGSYQYDHGRLDAGQEERFLIDRKIRASRVECGIATADAVQNTDAESTEESL
jgi:serine/threonine protein kinase